MRKVCTFLLLSLLLFSLSAFSVSCRARKNTTQQKSPSVSPASSLSGGLTTPVTATSLQLSSLLRSGSLDDQATQLHTTSGRLALALIINRLDNTQPVQELTVKSAHDLFSQIQILAPQKSQTLETLDRVYGLREILASEKIYVQIQANDVVSSAPTSQLKSAGQGWESRFEAAISSAG